MATIRSLEQEITSLQRQASEHRREYEKLKGGRFATLATGNAIAAISARNTAKHHEEEAMQLEKRIEQYRHEIEDMRRHVADIDRELQRTKDESREKIRYIEEQTKRHISELEHQKQHYTG